MLQDVSGESNDRRCVYVCMHACTDVHTLHNTIAPLCPGGSMKPDIAVDTCLQLMQVQDVTGERHNQTN